MVPLIIITVSEIHHALRGSNFKVLYFDGQCLKMIQSSACDTLQ